MYWINGGYYHGEEYITEIVLTLLSVQCFRERSRCADLSSCVEHHPLTNKLTSMHLISVTVRSQEAQRIHYSNNMSKVQLFIELPLYADWEAAYKMRMGKWKEHIRELVQIEADIRNENAKQQRCASYVKHAGIRRLAHCSSGRLKKHLDDGVQVEKERSQCVSYGVKGIERREGRVENLVVNRVSV